MTVILRPMLPVDENRAVYQGGDYYTLNANNAGIQVTSSASGQANPAVGPCFLHTINLTNAGSAWVISIYDGTSTTGTPIVISASSPNSWQLFLKFYIGIFIVASGTTPGSITLSYSTQITT